MIALEVEWFKNIYFSYKISGVEVRKKKIKGFTAQKSAPSIIFNP